MPTSKQQQFNSKLAQIPTNILNYSYYKEHILILFSFWSQTVQDIREIIRKEKKVKQMERLENDNA